MRTNNSEFRYADTYREIRFGGYTLIHNRGLYAEDRPIALPPKELALLELLLLSGNEVVSHRSIEDAVWPGQVVNYASLARCVYSLRQKLNDPGKAILATVAKQGYRITVPVAIIRDEHFSTLERSIRTQPLAHSHFQAGMQASNSPDAESLSTAIEMFRKAIDLDPEYAVAYAAIADVLMYQVLRGYISPIKARKEILTASSTALSIDSRLAPALAAKGWCLGVLEGKFTEGMANLDKSHQIDPNYARLYSYRSWLWRSVGNTEEAVQAALQATRIDPHSLLIRHAAAWTLFCGNEVEKAFDMERTAAMEYPRDDVAQSFAGLMAAYLGDYSTATEFGERALALSDDSTGICSSVAYIYARKGDRAKALELAHLAMRETRSDGYCQGVRLAPAYVALCDTEYALSLIEHSRVLGCPWLAIAHTDPRLFEFRDSLQLKFLSR